jgi:hypothetical protein
MMERAQIPRATYIIRAGGVNFWQKRAGGTMGIIMKKVPRLVNQKLIEGQQQIL